jgi:hypothetical protein
MRGPRFLAATMLATLCLVPVPRLANAEGASTSVRTRLTVARLQYEGDDWYANPSSLPNLIRAIRARTTLAVEPNEVRLTLLDERLWDHPFLHLTGHG